MDIYEAIEIGIEYLNNEDVITTSSEVDETDHDNAYVDFDVLE